MDNDLTTFLRARYAEQREAEMSKRRTKDETPPYTMIRDWDSAYVLLGEGDSRLRPRLTIEEFNERYTDPDPDPFVLADLDAKLGIIEQFTMIELPAQSNGDTAAVGAYVKMQTVLRLLVRPYADHADYEQAVRP